MQVSINKLDTATDKSPKNKTAGCKKKTTNGGIQPPPPTIKMGR